MISKEDLKKFVETYGYFYFSKNKLEDKEYVNKKQNTLGKNVKLSTSEEKVEEIAENSVFPKSSFEVPCQKITWQHIAWKAGRLKYNENGEFLEEYKKTIKHSDKCYAWDECNGYGHSIDNIEEYLEVINEECKTISSDLLKEEDNKNVYTQLYNAYDKLLNLQKKTKKKKVNYFGSVYILTLIYFLSKGKFPIFDKYAYKAVKALFYNANPKDITVESSLDKTDINKVLTLYCEYCWLLTQIFKTYIITREQDRALWVYGHSKKKFPVSDNATCEKKLFDFDRTTK